jgi:hypothetical protein
MPHATPKHSSPDKREKRERKAFKSFNKELLNPDPNFRDERKHKYIPKDKKSFLDKLFGV